MAWVFICIAITFYLALGFRIGGFSLAYPGIIRTIIRAFWNAVLFYTRLFMVAHA